MNKCLLLTQEKGIVLPASPRDQPWTGDKFHSHNPVYFLIVTRQIPVHPRTPWSYFCEHKWVRFSERQRLDALQQDYELGEGKSLPQFLAPMRPVRETLGRIRAADLSETRVDRYIKARLDAGRRPSTVNRETQLLGQAFRLAKNRRWVNRLPHIRRLPERNARQGFFEAEDIEAVIAHLPHYLKDFVRFGYLSGW